jgi:hypothetical protein
MTSQRKRPISEMAEDRHTESASMLQRIRNMWQFANLAQWIYLFGKIAKIPESVDIEVGMISRCAMVSSSLTR